MVFATSPLPTHLHIEKLIIFQKNLPFLLNLEFKNKYFSML